jgi:hypothetical protein
MPLREGDPGLTGQQWVQLWSLSPSPEDILKSMREFASLFVPISEYASGIAPLKHNSASVVILLIVGRQAILLGSDLEAPSYPQAGWNAIVGSTIRPEALSTMFKIPHHGSAGAF